MRGTTHLAGILAVSLTALASACSDPSDDAPQSEGTAGPVRPQELVGIAFELSIPEEVSSTSEPWCSEDCRPATVAVTAASETTLQAVWGRPGHAQLFSLSASGDTWTLDEGILLGTRNGPYAICNNPSELRSAEFSFVRSDKGEVVVTIDGHASHRRCEDDTGATYEFDLLIPGVPDRRPATVAAWSRVQDPLEGVALYLDKPLIADSSAQLDPVQGGDLLPLVPIDEAGWVVGFSTSRVLPIHSVYLLSVDGTDLGGVGTPPSVEIRTLNDFGVLPQDGFESGQMVGFRWDARFQAPAIVDSYLGAIEAITGERMLLIPRGARTMLRLQRAPEHTGVSMNLRIVNNCLAGDPKGAVKVTWAVVGSDHREVQSVSAAETSLVELEPPMEVGEVQRLELPLTGSGEFVLVALEGDWYEGAGCRSVTTLVDDVMTEILP